MPALELIEIGDSVGVILPPELLALLKLGEGDELLCTEIPNGVLLTRANQVPDAS